MEITATGKLKYKDSGLVDQLKLTVEFKLPNKLFKVKRERVLTSAWWIGNQGGYKNFIEFQEDTLKVLENKEYVIGVVSQMVKDYINGDAKDIKKSNNEKSIKKLLKESSEIKVNVKIN
jgi:hypothetical protein